MNSLEYREKNLKALSPEWKKIQTSNKITKNQFDSYIANGEYLTATSTDSK